MSMHISSKMQFCLDHNLVWRIFCLNAVPPLQFVLTRTAKNCCCCHFNARMTFTSQNLCKSMCAHKNFIEPTHREKQRLTMTSVILFISTPSMSCGECCLMFWLATFQTGDSQHDDSIANSFLRTSFTHSLLGPCLLANCAKSFFLSCGSCILCFMLPLDLTLYVPCFRIP